MRFFLSLGIFDINLLFDNLKNVIIFKKYIELSNATIHLNHTFIPKKIWVWVLGLGMGFIPKPIPKTPPKIGYETHTQTQVILGVNV